MYFLYPLYIIISLVGVYFLLLSKQRENSLKNRLMTAQEKEREKMDADELLSDKNISSVEKIMRKSNKLITLTSLLDKNVIVKALFVCFISILLFILNATEIINFSISTLSIIILIVIVVVILLPDKIKKGAIRSGIKKISNDLPFIIDMMAVCIQSGMTVEKSLRYLADNTSDINRDIAALLDRTMLKAEVSGIGAALDLLYEEVPCIEIRMFCSTLQQSIKYGSSMYEQLLELSKEIREMQLLQAEEKISSLSAKMTIPMILFIMLPILAMVAGPGILRMLQEWGKL